jgi:hypothetical protein
VGSSLGSRIKAADASRRYNPAAMRLVIQLITGIQDFGSRAGSSGREATGSGVECSLRRQPGAVAVKKCEVRRVLIHLGPEADSSYADCSARGMGELVRSKTTNLMLEALSMLTNLWADRTYIRL